MFIEKLKIEAKLFTRVLFLFCVFFVLSSQVASAASLILETDRTTLSVGEVVNLDIIVDTENVSINNVEAKLSFPVDLIEVVSINKNGSILTLWVEDPSFSNSAGIVTFNGGVPNPGYTGVRGKVLSLSVKAKKSGQADFIFSNTAVRANDGLGTNVLNSQRGILLAITQQQPTLNKDPLLPSSTPTSVASNIKAVEIKSSTHPDESKWYANNEPEFSWELPDGALEVRTLIGTSPSGVPSVSYLPAISKKKIDELPDGIYYFYLRVRTASGWSPISRYKINIDTKPPKPFSITFPHGDTGFEPQPVILFNTTDDNSGISHYEIRIGEDQKPLKTAPLTLSNPYVLPPQEPGNYKILVTAFDNSGNTRVSSADFIIEGIDSPEIINYQEYMNEGDILKITGVTYPDSDVSVFIREGDKLVSEEYTRSNYLGDFSLIASKRLDSGFYNFTAKVIDARGATSKETIPLNISVRSGFSSNTVVFVLKYLSLGLICIIVIGAIAFISTYIWFGIQKTARRLRNEVDQAEDTTHRSFKLLRSDIEDYLQRMRSIKRRLTPEEVEFLSKFEDNLKEAEKIVSKEIRDVSGK